MTQEEKVKEIREKVYALVNEAIELLENNYDMDIVEVDNSAYQTMMDLNGALMALDFINDEGLKIED
jgi:hypothetical protein